jgi:hypothetical protein
MIETTSGKTCNGYAYIYGYGYGLNDTEYLKKGWCCKKYAVIKY